MRLTCPAWSGATPAKVVDGAPPALNASAEIGSRQDGAQIFI
jgi:hypothetical protein